jgi:hypothetical protein
MTTTRTRKDDPKKEVMLLTSEMNFEEIKNCLEKVSGPTGKPMIVNRGGQGSPSSSIELVSDDILTATPFSCTGNSSLFKLNKVAVADTFYRVIWIFCRGVSI